MGSLAEVPISTVRRSLLPRLLLWIAGVLLLLVLGLGGYAFYVAESALPRMDGRLQVRGLTAPVTVTRDSHGVPTIDAASLPDLFFAQGYVTAQDRLWQMDIMRRYGAGELSEILGEDTLKIDREQRILGLRDAAKKSLEIASPREHSFFEAYASGVNAYIENARSHLPIEFRILRYAPKPWTAEDSVVVANQMVKDLNFHYFYDALAR
ncbi:MAG: penicillin acylase family protein, partial [Acidobacteria bacterium]